MVFYLSMIFKVIIIKFHKVILKLLKKEEEETRIDYKNKVKSMKKFTQKKIKKKKFLSQTKIEINDDEN